jgi:Flp pilus assembly protein TadG
MRKLKNIFCSLSGERGSITPIVALGLMVFIGFLALSIDLGQLYVVRNELQNIADGAALAGAKKLVQDKAGTGVAVVYCEEAIQAAIDCAKKNYSFGAADAITITAADVTLGQWDLSTKSFVHTGCTASPSQMNAVQVTVRRNDESNPGVATFLGSTLGLASRREAEARAVAYLGLAGTSAIDVPLAVPATWTSGDGPTDDPRTFTSLPRFLAKLGPAPAQAALPKTYKYYDVGGSNLDTTRATMVVPESAQLSLTYLQKYIKGTESNGLRFPQKKVGEKLYPISEYKWGSNVKSNYTLLKTRWNNHKNASNKWRVTVAAYSTTQTISSQPQDSWFQLASRLLPGVSQAHACAAYTVPAVYNDGFVTVDITDVVVPSCNTSTNQVTDSNSCRNKCYAEIEPVNQDTVSTDKGSNPIPTQRDYHDMNPPAGEVGVFAATPRIVR